MFTSDYISLLLRLHLSPLYVFYIFSASHPSMISYFDFFKNAATARDMQLSLCHNDLISLDKPSGVSH